MKHTPIELSIVIPVFNEAANIAIVVNRSLQVLNQQSEEKPYELLLVDDGSTDGTGPICDDLQQQYQPVRVFHHTVNQGFGGALKTGFLNAGGRLVSFIPGDGEVTIEQVVKLCCEIGDADIIVSTRSEDSAKPGKPVRSWFRGCLTWGLRHLLMIVLGYDPSGKEGIFLIRNEKLQSLHLTSKTGLLTAEILMQCYRTGCVVKESTIQIQPRLSGQSKVTKFSNYLKYLWEIFKLRFK